MNFEYEAILKAHQKTSMTSKTNQNFNLQKKSMILSLLWQLGQVTLLKHSNMFQTNCCLKIDLKNQGKKYQIQFVSISIGKWFPNTISNQLRAQLHNTEFIEPIYHHDKNPERTEDEMFNFFAYTFQIIRSQSLVYQDLLETDKEVKLTLISNPQNTLPAGALFISESKLASMVNQQNLQMIQKIKKTYQLNLLNSEVDEKALEKFFQAIKEFSDLVVNEVKQDNQQQGQTEQEQKLDIQFNNAILIVNQFAVGDVDLDQCTPNTLTDLQAKLSNPDASAGIQLIAQQISVSDNLKDLEPDNINAIQKKKLKNVGCYARAQAKMKQIQQLQQTYESAQITMAKEIIINGLKKYKSLFTQNQQQQKFLMNTINPLLLSLIQSNWPRKLIQLDQLRKPCLQKEAIKILDNVLAHAGIGIQQSMAIPDINDEFEFLPESLKSQIRPENDERENFVVAIFDKNDSMKNEIDSAIQNFNQEFSQIETIKLFWQNTKFSLFDFQYQYSSLVDIFKQFEEKNYALKTKKICICLITDGKNDYTKLHKQLKALNQINTLQNYHMLLQVHLFIFKLQMSLIE
ncbi:unnamed protein product [Paramecium octaurelia]|uniref:Uncharacterized protein n=1 Tax=Paramecium octaurelia TaxID=43137 RepID=A0A8S1XJ63_PAROT|nr:unnamed protein product [Paramecium octaurelia]